MQNNFELGHGAIVSPQDEKQWVLGAATSATADKKSNFIDISWAEPSMQSKLGCCVGCSYEEVRRLILFITEKIAHNPGTDQELSFRFVYAMCKSLEGTKGYEIYGRTADANDGTYPALAAEVIRKWGVPLAKFCPNDTTLSADDFCYGRNLNNIPKEAIADAIKRKGGNHFTENCTESGIKRAIDYAKEHGGGVTILRLIGKTYWTDVNGNSTWDKNKIVPIRPTSDIVSGHEELLTGYDTEEGTGRTRIYWLNHWSKAWADNGRAWEYLDVWLPYIKEVRVFVPEVPSQDNFRYTFNKTLSLGDKGPDVVALQHILKIENCFSYPTFTGSYGNITFQGVKALQEKYANDILVPAGLKIGTGRVGPQTLLWLNNKYGI